MIDFHTHILPRIDDGASSLEESLALLRMLEEQGVDTVALTPHYYGRQDGVERFLEKRSEAYRALIEAYTGPVRLLAGCECNIDTCANADMSDLAPLALEGARYIRAELSFSPKTDERIFRRLRALREAGLVPVIAHAELYPVVRKHPGLAADLIGAGCLLQINCESVMREGKNGLARALIAHGQAHCLGSDTHDTTRRPPLYREAVETLTREFGAAVVEKMQENMEKIVGNESLHADAGEPVKRKLFGYA